MGVRAFGVARATPALPGAPRVARRHAAPAGAPAGGGLPRPRAPGPGPPRRPPQRRPARPRDRGRGGAREPLRAGPRPEPRRGRGRGVLVGSLLLALRRVAGGGGRRGPRGRAASPLPWLAAAAGRGARGDGWSRCAASSPPGSWTACRGWRTSWPSGGEGDHAAAVAAVEPRGRRRAAAPRPRLGPRAARSRASAPTSPRSPCSPWRSRRRAPGALDGVQLAVVALADPRRVRGRGRPARGLARGWAPCASPRGRLFEVDGPAPGGRASPPGPRPAPVAGAARPRGARPALHLPRRAPPRARRREPPPRAGPARRGRGPERLGQVHPRPPAAALLGRPAGEPPPRRRRRAGLALRPRARGDRLRRPARPPLHRDAAREPRCSPAPAPRDDGAARRPRRGPARRPRRRACREGSTPGSASRASSSREASGSASRSPARCCGRRPSCSSTSRPRTSTPSPSAR